MGSQVIVSKKNPDFAGGRDYISLKLGNRKTILKVSSEGKPMETPLYILRSSPATILLAAGENLSSMTFQGADRPRATSNVEQFMTASSHTIG